MSAVYEEAIREELARWPGVTVEFGKRAKHREAVLSYRGKARFVVYPDSPSDGQRGHLNCIADVRRELAALSAERLEKQPKKRKRTRKVVSHRAPDWTRRATDAPVKADPWQALQSLAFEPAPRKGHLREALRRVAGSVRRMAARFRKECARKEEA